MSASDRQRPKRFYDNGMTAGQVWNNRIAAAIVLGLVAYSWLAPREHAAQPPQPLHAAPAQQQAPSVSHSR